MLLLWSIAKLLVVGGGIGGVNVPIGWGFAITNFVWWIRIGHAGTLISAILLLLRPEWRTSINRFAEAMTLFAVACAGQPHGRPVRVGVLDADRCSVLAPQLLWSRRVRSPRRRASCRVEQVPGALGEQARSQDASTRRHDIYS